jgi:hypothetical protein
MERLFTPQHAKVSTMSFTKKTILMFKTRSFTASLHGYQLEHAILKRGMIQNESRTF